MGPELFDGELLARPLDDPSAFADLYERHGQAVRRYVNGRVGSGPGEDVAGEVFVRAFRARQHYRPERESALPWLLAIANHVIADHARAERRRLKALQRLARIAPGTVEPDAQAIAPDLVRQLRRLSRVDRDALLLVVWGELTYEETAAALGVPIGTVSSRIARARRKLAASIEPTDHASAADTPAATATHA